MIMYVLKSFSHIFILIVNLRFIRFTYIFNLNKTGSALLYTAFNIHHYISSKIHMYSSTVYTDCENSSIFT